MRFDRNMTDPKPKNRTGKTKQATASSRFEPNERHKQILLLVHEHRFLTTQLLWHLLRADEPEAQAQGDIGRDGKQRPSQYGFGQQALYKVLQKLREERYLRQHPLLDRLAGRGSGSESYVYGLGPKSARYLSDILGCPPRDIQEIVQANNVKSGFLRHSLEIARFRVTLERACRESDGAVRLIFWEQGMRLRDFIIVRNPSHEEALALKEYGSDSYPEETRLSVCPDAMFALEVRDKGRVCYMLEMDRGTMPIRRKSDRSDIVKKLIAYRNYRKVNRQGRRYAYRVLADDHAVGLLVNTQPDVPAEDVPGVLPLKGFNVLFVVPTGFDRSGRPEGRIANILSEMMQLGTDYATTSLFWFTSPLRYDVGEPATMFSRIWIAANPHHGVQSLII